MLNILKPINSGHAHIIITYGCSGYFCLVMHEGKCLLPNLEKKKKSMHKKKCCQPQKNG